MCVIHGGTLHLVTFECMVLYLTTGLINERGELVREVVRSFHKSAICASLTVCVLYMVENNIW
jgi:hypothetical protein